MLRWSIFQPFDSTKVFSISVDSPPPLSKCLNSQHSKASKLHHKSTQPRPQRTSSFSPSTLKLYLPEDDDTIPIRSFYTASPHDSGKSTFGLVRSAARTSLF